MDIIKFEKMVNEDFFIDRENIHNKLYEIPNIHSKYLRFFYQKSKALIQVKTDLDILYIKRRKYYLNECDEVIKDTQLKFYIDGDTEYSKKRKEVRQKELELKVIEDALKRCGTISFFCQNIINYEKFLVGS